MRSNGGASYWRELGCENGPTVTGGGGGAGAGGADGAGGGGGAMEGGGVSAAQETSAMVVASRKESVRRMGGSSRGGYSLTTAGLQREADLTGRPHLVSAAAQHRLYFFP